MKAQAFVFGSVAAILLAACAPHGAGPTQAQLNTATNDGTNWLYVDHDYRGQRYTPLVRVYLPLLWFAVESDEIAEQSTIASARL